MFKGVGGKIKGLVWTVCAIGIFFCVAIGFILFLGGVTAEYESMQLRGTILGLIIGVGGSLLLWINSLVIYAFGQLVENSDKQVELLARIVVNDAEDESHKETYEV